MNNFKASLVKYLCPICGKESEDAIIMNSLLTEKVAKQVEELNGKALGFSENACQECAKYKDQAVYFIGIDPEKSGKTLESFYRTGQLVGVKKEASLVKQCEEFIRETKDGTRFCFIDEKIGKEIGLWQ